jgi:hypothetical protein
MLTDLQKGQIRLYSVAESNRKKSDRRRADAEEVARGNAEAVQERNRLVPPELLVFPDSEDALPAEDDQA